MGGALPLPVDDLVDLRLPVTPGVVGAHWRRGAEPVGGGQPAVWGDVVAKQRILLQVTAGQVDMWKNKFRVSNEAHFRAGLS